MAIHPDFKKLSIDSLKENLIAVDYCMSFQKAGNAAWGKDDAGCLGMPALILLCSVIDSMGSYFRDTSTTISVNGEDKKIERVADHFLILNHSTLFNLKLDGKVIYDFYTKYRSPLTHNNTLPMNVVMDIGSVSDSIFQTNASGEVELVRLAPLLNKVRETVDVFIHYLQNGNWSTDHKLTKELLEKSNKDTPSVLSGLNPTANTKTIR